VTPTTDPSGDAPALAPPPFAERTLGALVADALLREAVLGDLAEEFAERCALHGPARARRWYRVQAARSAPPLLAATCWPASGGRARRAGELLAAGLGGLVLVQLLHQAAQLLTTRALTSAGLAAGGALAVACSLVAGAGCAVLAGAVAARRVRGAPLAGALALATVLGALAVAGVVANGGAAPLWYWVGLQLVVLPAGAFAGGLLRARVAAPATARASIVAVFCLTGGFGGRPAHAQLRADARGAPLVACRAQRGAMRQAVQDVHERQKNVGLAALVLRGGTPVLAEYLGYADLEQRTPVTRATRFGVASVTKAFTGVALLKLHEAGRLDLDAPVQRYVPAFPEKPGAPITPRLLAAHRAGLRHWKDGERTPALYATHFDDVARAVALFAGDSLVAPPGTRYGYSSPGYNLLAAAIQSASGERFQDHVARVVLGPLGLTNTGFDDVRRVNPHRARRYAYYDPYTFAPDTARVFRVPEWDYSHNMGGGNMYSTAEDLARFGRAVVRPGLLSRASLELLAARAPGDTAGPVMNAGWFVRAAGRGPRRVHVNGSNAGLQAAVYVYPDADLVVVVLSNTHGVGAQSGEMVVELPERLAGLCAGWATGGALPR
jgi:CubicO group peptidase (beta-lactamase class C family)